MVSTWSMDEYHENEDDDGENSLVFTIMLILHFVLFILVYFWLYPTAEPPKNAIMHKLGTNIKKSRITGEPICLTSQRLSIREIRYLSRRIPCQERKYQLSEDDQKTLTAVSEGEVNYLRQLSDLATDKAMNYGSLITKRGVPIPEEVKKDTEEQIENLDEAAAIEDLYQLRRMHKSEKVKNKKKKTKERQDALDQLTRGENVKMLSRILPISTERHVQSRKVTKTVSRIQQLERTQDNPTLEEDKTQERVIKKKPSSRPTQKPSSHDIMKKKSGTKRERKSLTDLSLAQTMEESRKPQSTASSREPPV